MKNKLRKSKKAQEEMVGFVIIVVLVVVIGVIVLGISIRNRQGASLESKEIESFLSSVSDFTTECEIPSQNPLAIKDLIIKCSESGECSDGRNSCEVLRDTLSEIIEHSTFIVSEESGLYYYDLRVYEVFEGVEQDIIEPVSKISADIAVGECPGWEMYNDRVFYSSESRNIYLGLRVCREN